MSRLAIHTLGMPRIEYAGNPLEFDRRKAVALLIYLALSDGVRGRDALATLLWPEYDQSRARGNLRRALFVLNAALNEDLLLIDRDTVSLRRNGDMWVDVQQFERLLGECRTHGHAGDQVCVRCLEPLAQAVALYRDDFLTGFTLADAPEFDEWQRYLTESLRMKLSGALGRLVEGLVAQGDNAAALAHAQRRLALDPLDEAAQRQLMQVHAWAGDRSAALRQYQSCAALLRRELSTTPAPETTALFEAISQNRLPPPVPFALPSAQPPSTTESSKQAPSPSQNEDGAQGELRPVTILCVGLAGEAEPEATVTGLDRLLSSLETILGRYEARLDRLLGDSVIAVFGARQVHEDDAERAIQAALALVEGAGASSGAIRQPPGISVGVVTGEAYLGPVGRGGQVTHSVLGPLVNRAARLQGRAASGQVLVDQVTYRRTHQAFAYRSPDITGTPASAQAYEVAGALARPTKTRGIEGLRAELIGRDEELAKLEAALARVRAGQGQAVSLISEAGLGKSRLVADLKERGGSTESAKPSQSAGQSAIAIPHSAIVWLEGRCLEMATSTSYAPFVDMLRSYFSASAAGDAPCDPSLLACVIRNGLQSFRDEGYLTADQVEEIGPLLGNLLSVNFGDDWDERLRMADPGQIRHRTFAALRTFFAVLADRQPTVLVLEDLHWADSLSLDLIGELMGLLADHPLLLLCVYRPGREYPSERLAPLAERRCMGRYTELRLHPLTAEESRYMLALLLTVEGLPAQAREVIVAQGEGNPFFTEEIVRGLIDAGLLYRDGATWRAQEHIAVARAPEGVQGVILSRVDRLAPGDRQVLQAASVLGRLFRPRVLARLVAPELSLEAALDRLVERDFVYLERSWPEGEYSFKHVLTQEAVYGTLLAGRKTQLHRQAGEAIEALYADSLAEHYEALAHHYDRGDGGGKAVEYLLKAGEKARRAYLNDEAIAYFARALARCEQVPTSASQGEGCAADRLEALTGLGKVHFLVGHFVEAEEWLRKAISLGHELDLAPTHLARLYIWLGEALYWQNRHQEMARLGEEGLLLLGDAAESVEGVPLSYLIVIGLRFAGEERRFWEGIARISKYIGRLPYSEELRSAYVGVASFHHEWEKNLQEAQRWLDMLEQHSRCYHDRRALVEVLLARGVIQFRAGNCQSAVHLSEQAFEECSRIGDVSTRFMAYDGLCGSNLNLGRLDQAETWARRLLEDWMGTDDAGRTAHALVTLGIVSLCAEDDRRASSMADEISELLPRLRSRWRFLITLRLAELYLALDRHTDALALYEVMFREFEPKALCLWWRRERPYPAFPAILHGLEEACCDSTAFQTICQDYRAKYPEAVTMSFPQWYLEPADIQIVVTDQRHVCDFDQETAESLFSGEWRWHDSYGDCSYDLQPASGLVVSAANGRDLFHLNQSAPRLLRPVSDDFVAETVCLAADDRPAMGGLLLWRDKENYLRVERGRRGRGEVLFDGCAANQDAVFGRGRLPGQPKKVHLRLARRGERVDALCSADGEMWWSVGHASFPTDDPVQIGVCAIGMIDRTIYPGAYREGAAIRFESFRMW